MQVRDWNVERSKLTARDRRLTGVVIGEEEEEDEGEDDSEVGGGNGFDMGRRSSTGVSGRDIEERELVESSSSFLTVLVFDTVAICRVLCHQLGEDKALVRSSFERDFKRRIRLERIECSFEIVEGGVDVLQDDQHPE
ncbi:hypothetical protein EC973_002178 [Apophysomyces ossiformis]|uniref:Uncharacterized protein n=1 Tax=Apophysomyces ossiformis TaxID=679940 RepID=A0A8H7ELV7_9FUNG|nr:hypothetical protein EC973_002178 [Apophysomyces ossiformis]